MHNAWDALARAGSSAQGCVSLRHPLVPCVPDLNIARGCTAYNHNLDTSREHYSKVDIRFSSWSGGWKQGDNIRTRSLLHARSTTASRPYPPFAAPALAFAQAAFSGSERATRTELASFGRLASEWQPRHGKAQPHD